MAIDFGALPTIAEAEIHVFTAQGAANIWTPWTKPQNCTLIGLLTLGAGAGAGGGFSGGTGAGGGGGGSGGIASALWAASMLPDVLYVNAALGGNGGAADTIGSAGPRSYVAFSPDGGAVPTLPILRSGEADAAGGPAGIAGLVLGGVGSTATDPSTLDFVGSALGFSSVGGQIGGGSDSGVAAPGVSVVWGSSGLVVSSGAGGGPVALATAQAGGGQIGAGLIMSLLGGAVGAAGPQGISFLARPFAALGGCGGGGNAVVGGAGGNGGLGSGGGGGGAGTVGGGLGGRGGDGRVWIVAF